MSSQHEIEKSANYSIQSKKQNTLIGDWIKSESDYAIALTYSEKKIGEYNKEDMRGLVDVIAKWRLLLGVTSESSDVELVVITQFVYDNFKWFTLADIKLAMNWTISGKVEVGYVTQKNISSYYVSRALNAYDEVKREIVQKLAADRDKYNRGLIEAEKNKKVTAEDKANSFKDMVLTCYEAHTKGQKWYDFGDFIFNWLKAINKIDRNPNLIQQAVDYGQRMYNEYKKESNHFLKFAANDTDEDRDKLQKKFGRQFMVKIFFDTHDVKEIVSLINVEYFKNK